MRSNIDYGTEAEQIAEYHARCERRCAHPPKVITIDWLLFIFELEATTENKVAAENCLAALNNHKNQ